MQAKEKRKQEVTSGMLNNGATFRLLAVTKAASQVVKNKIFMVFASE